MSINALRALFCLGASLTAPLAASAFAQTPASGNAASVPGDPSVAQQMETRQRLTEAISRIASNPNDAAAFSQAGRAALQLGDPRAALGFLARAELLSPRDPVIKAALGAAMVQLEDPVQALRFFDAAVALGGLDRAYLAERGLAYDLLGDQVRAQADYANAATFAPSAEVTRRHAVSLGISGRVDDAVIMLAPLLRAQDRGAWRSRAMILAMNGRGDEARQIAAATMPAQLASALTPYFNLMDRLTPQQLAAAAHFGRFPRYEVVAAQPVRTAPRVQVAAASPASGAASGARRGRRTAGDQIAQARGQDRRNRPRNASSTVTPVGTVAGSAAAPAAVSAPPVANAPRTQAPAAAPSIAPRTLPPQPAPAPSPTPVRPTILQPSLRPTIVQPAPNVAVTPSPVVPVPTPAPAAAPIPGAGQMRVAAAPVASPSVTPSAQTQVAPPPSPAVAPVPPPVASAGNNGSTAPTYGPADVGRPSVLGAPQTAASALPPVAALAPAAGPVSIELPPRSAGSIATAMQSPNVAAPQTPAPAPTSAQSALAPSTPASDTVVLEGWSLAGLASSVEVPEAERAAAAQGLSIDELDRIAAEGRRRAAEAEARRRAQAEQRAREERTAQEAARAAAATERAAEAAREREAQERLRSQPARQWVQIATGADANALRFDYRRLAQRNAEIFRGQSGATAVWNRSRRLVVGPFPSAAAARAWLARYRAAGGDGFVWASEAGEDVTPLPAR